eukprot:7797738-Ditylum_brightwellii.AAC.1
MQTTALGSAIQIHQGSTWERYTNTPPQHLGALYKYTKKALGSTIKKYTTITHLYATHTQ